MKTVERWKTDSLARIAKITMGQSPDSKYYSEEENGLPFLQGCAEFGSRFPNHFLYCSQTKKVAKAGSILFSVRAPVGRINIADRDYIIGRGLASILAEDVDQAYLEHYLRHEESKFSNASQGSTFEAINSTELSKWPMDYPTSKREQAKIAEILSTVDRAIEETEALIAKQQRIKTGLMQNLLTRGIDEHGNLRSEKTHKFKDSAFGRIPTEWDVTPILSFASHSPNSLANGPFGSDLLASELTLEGIPVIYVRDIKPGAYQRVSTAHVMSTKADRLSACNVLQGDVLVAKVGDPPCDAAVYTEQTRAVVTQDVIRIRPSSEVAPGFLCCLLNSHLGRKAIQEIVIRGTRSRVSLTEFNLVKLPKPIFKEQIVITEIIESMEIDLHKARIHSGKLRSMKTALMQDLLTGTKRVTTLLNDDKDRSILES